MQCRLYLQHYLPAKATVIRVFITYNTNNTGNTTHTSSNHKIASMGRKQTVKEKNRKSKTESMNTARMVLIVLTVVADCPYQNKT